MFQRVVTTVVLGAIVGVVGATRLEATPIFANGSFEADPATFSSIDPTGWVTHRIDGPPYVVNNNTYGNTPYGHQFAAIGGVEDNEVSWLEQTVSGFTPGATYELTFAQSSEYVSSDQLRVSFTAGSSTPAQIFTTAPYPGGSQFWFNWTNESMLFVPDATSVTFHLQGVPGSGSYEVGVDNFQISEVSGTAVPEPTSVTLLGAGLASLIARRRHKRLGVK